jgi:hypothetical protein
MARQWALASACCGSNYGTAWCCPAPGNRPSRRAGQHSGTGGLRRRVPVRPASTAGAGARRPCPASSTRTPRWRCRMGRRCRRNGRCRSFGFLPRKLSAGGRQRLGRRSRRGAGARLGRRLQTLDLLSGSRAAAGAARAGRLGGRRPREKGRGRNRRRGRTAGPRPHRDRPAQRHSGDGCRQRRDLQRFRADAYRRRAGHADHGHFRPDQPLPLGAAEWPWPQRSRPRPWFPASPAIDRSV